METTQTNQTSPTPTLEIKMAKCEQCGNSFPYRKSKRFCSSTCRVKHNIISNPFNTINMNDTNRDGQMGLGFTPKPIAPVKAENPYFQMMINHLTKDAERWEKEFKAEQDRRRKAEAQVQELKDKLRDTQMEYKITAAENQKPKGLNGLMESPAVKEMAPYLMGMLGKVVDRFIGAGGGDNPQINGTNMAFNWISSLPEDQQTSIYSLLGELSQLKDPSQLTTTIVKIINLLKNGSTLSGTNPTGSRANYSAVASF